MSSGLVPDADVSSRARVVRFACALALAAAAATMSSGCRDRDVVTNSYATLAEARDAGAARRGEIPPGVPEGAHDIRTASDQDSDRRWGLFDFLAQDADALRAMLNAEEISLAGVECDIPGRIEWWPVLLRGTVNAEQAKAAGLQSYRSRQGSLVFVVNWKQGRAYYWGGE
jgi:hypothetical protein